jgi:hypothetical protein
MYFYTFWLLSLNINVIKYANNITLADLNTRHKQYYLERLQN